MKTLILLLVTLFLTVPAPAQNIPGLQAAIRWNMQQKQLERPSLQKQIQDALRKAMRVPEKILTWNDVERENQAWHQKQLDDDQNEEKETCQSL